jgi:two-component system, response regulator
MTDRTILLVEDNPDDQELTRRALQRINILNPLVIAADGAEALDFLFRAGKYARRNRDDPPAVVLLDLKLPKIDGLEVLRRVRDDPATRMTPVIVLTSSPEEQDLIRSYRLGANSYIRKPVNFAQFSDAVRQLGLYWLMLNQPPRSTAVDR